MDFIVMYYKESEWENIIAWGLGLLSGEGHKVEQPN